MTALHLWLPMKVVTFVPPRKDGSTSSFAGADAHGSDEDFSDLFALAACYLTWQSGGVASLCHHVEIRHWLSGTGDYLLGQQQ
jgi:hypothetical protein